MDTTENYMQRPPGPPSYDEITEYLAGFADDATVRRVAGVQLMHPGARRRGAACERLERTNMHEFRYEVGDDAFEVRAGRLRERMAAAARSFVVENRQVARDEAGGGDTAPDAEPFSGVLRRVSEGALAAITGLVKQSLVLGRHAMTLPGFAPAAAAAPDELDLPRQTFTTPEGVRIEFQQLPGATNRVRAVVDASALPDRGEKRYNAAFLVLEESHPTGTPDRHVLVVSLNDQGRGFTDVLIGGEGTVSALPTPQSACHLVGATISRVTGASGLRAGGGSGSGEGQS